MDGTYQWQDVADALNTRMLQIGLTQRALSERSRVSLTTLRELAHRQRSARTLAAISEALGWQPDHLRDVVGHHRPALVIARGQQQTVVEPAQMTPIWILNSHHVVTAVTKLLGDNRADHLIEQQPHPSNACSASQRRRNSWASWRRRSICGSISSSSRYCVQ